MFAAVFVLGACSSEPAIENLSTAADLESAAIERGLVRDPDATAIVGLYARDTDRVCIVPDGRGLRIGAFVDYGDDVTCSGAGSLTRSGERLRVDLGAGCAFDARYDGERIGFPAAMPAACANLCAKRASFAALEAVRLSDSQSEARAMRDADHKLLCRTG